MKALAIEKAYFCRSVSTLSYILSETFYTVAAMLYVSRKCLDVVLTVI